MPGKKKDQKTKKKGKKRAQTDDEDDEDEDEEYRGADSNCYRNEEHNMEEDSDGMSIADHDTGSQIPLPHGPHPKFIGVVITKLPPKGL